MSGPATGRASLADVYPRIVKPRGGVATPANLADYQKVRSSFTWEAARARLDGLPGGRGLNIAHEAVDRHADGPRADRHALRWIGRAGGQRNITYRELKMATNRFANALYQLGVREGDRVFVMAGRIPELYIAVLESIRVRTRRAVVTLDGNVPREAVVKLAENDAWYIFGVDRVINRLVVRA